MTLLKTLKQAVRWSLLSKNVTEAFVQGGLARIGEDDPDGEYFIWDKGDDRDFVLEAVKSGVEIREGRPPLGGY